MKKIPLQYAIVRFTPFVETGEFANVGVVMIAPRERYFGFKLETRKYGRITRFFDELDRTIFLRAMGDLREEMVRVKTVLKEHGFDRRRKNNELDFANDLFKEITRPRESIIRFGEPRVVLSENPKEALDRLFAHYIQRNFVTKQYRQKVLENGMQTLLNKAHMADRFVRERIGDDDFKVTFPFVEKRDIAPTQVIKPLHLNQDESTKIIETGGTWGFRLRELRKRHVLPKRVLFAVDGPTGRGKRVNAFHEAVEILEDTGVTVLPYSKQEDIIRHVSQTY